MNSFILAVLASFLFDFRLSVAQICLGVLIVLCQLPPTYWQFMIGAQSDFGFGLQEADHATDIILPGIWSGLFVSCQLFVGNVQCLLCRFTEVYYLFE